MATTNVSPHISDSNSARVFMLNVVCALLVLYIMAFFYYGIRALVLGLLSVLAAYVTDLLSQLIYRTCTPWYDFSTLITGLMLPLLLPASIPFHVPILAAVFAVGVAKHPFGGMGYNLFNPAGAGLAFVATCFPANILFLYPQPFTRLPVWVVPDSVVLSTGASFTLSIGGTPEASFLNLALGNAPGPMGASNSLVLLACLCFLIARKTLSWETPVSFLAVTSLLAFFFPRIAGSGIDSLWYENMSGILLFGAVFMLGDPVTSPVRRGAKLLYGAAAGAVMIVYRHWGRLEEGFVFVLLLMNALVWGFDTIVEYVIQHRRRVQREPVNIA